jgi:hypothetical protein
LLRVLVVLLRALVAQVLVSQVLVQASAQELVLALVRAQEFWVQGLALLF